MDLMQTVGIAVLESAGKCWMNSIRITNFILADAIYRMNGRFCEGGCREGNGTMYVDMQRAWLTKHGFVRKVQHWF